MVEQKQKDEINYENKQYLGKKLVKKNDTGKGKWEKIWKLQFKNGDFEQNITAFEPTSEKSIDIKDLEEGETYCVGWKVSPYEHPQHGTVKAKTMTYIGEQKDGLVTEYKNMKSNETAKEPEITQKEINDFFKAYEVIIKQNKLEMNLNHFIGMFYRSNNKHTIEIQMIEKEFNNNLEMIGLKNGAKVDENGKGNNS